MVSREWARQFEAETAIPNETVAGATVPIQRVDDPNHKEVRIYCYSEQREEKEQGINRRFCERFEAGLKDLEAVFRSFTSELGLRPVYHHKEIRVDDHLFITVLAYQFVQIIRNQLQEHDIQGRWSSLREILYEQQRVTASFQHADDGALHIRKATRPETELATIYQALNLDPLPGGVQKTYV